MPVLRFFAHLAAFLLFVALGPALAGPKHVIAFGDSLTAGYGLSPSDAYPAKLEAWLKRNGIDATVANAGVSGDTSSAARARIDWSLGDAKPDLIIVELGGNDALRGIDPKETRANMTAILRSLKARHTPILLAGMKAPRNLGKDYAKAFDVIYPDLAKSERVTFYPFFLDGVAADPKLNQADGIHPTAKGVDIIVSKLGPEVKKLLTRGGTAK